MTLRLGPAVRNQLAFTGRPCSGALTSLFGAIDALHPDAHTGVDIACAAGTPILAPADGFVFHRAVGDAIFGNWIILEHEGGWHTLYGHMESPPRVISAEVLKAGDLLGYVGNTGYSTGPHLHWGLAASDNPYLRRSGPLLDPLSYLYREEERTSPKLSVSNPRWGGYSYALARMNGHAVLELPGDERFDYYRLRLSRKG